MSDPALPRFVLLQLVRLIGAVVTATGAVILSHGQPALARVPDAVGAIMLVGGAVGFFALPRALAKYWKRRL